LVAATRIVTYRSTATRWLAAILAAFFFVFLGIRVGALAGAYKESHTIEGTVIGLLAVAVGLLGLTWCILAVGFMGVRLVEGGVVVQNWVRRVKVPWEHISSFRYMDHQQAELSLRET
jgi:hypothetical protein